MPRSKILVLGANGFIGRNLIEYFGEVGYAVLAPTRGELNLLDTLVVSKYLKKHKPDVVVLAAVNISSLSDNLQIYYNVDRCAVDYGLLITIGSGAEYDMRHYKPLMSESYFREHVPEDVYGLSKFIVASDVERNGKKAVNLRGFGVYGKHEDFTRRFISNNICRVLCGYDISMNKNMRFDYLYVRDLARIIHLFIESEPAHRNYNVCTSDPIELLDLAKLIFDIHGDKDTNILVREDGMRPEYSGDNSLFLREFGDFQFTKPETAIAEMYRWYRDSVDLARFCAGLSG